MEWAALITWVLTAGGGFFMLGVWLKNGGMKQSDTPGDRIRPPRILSHFALAATGLVLWLIFLATDSKALAWIAFALLLVVALLGFSMLAVWLRQRGREPALAGGGNVGAVGGGVPAEQHFPPGIVGLHGLLAATTLVLVFLVAVGVGS
jgi:hypothetical protein